MKYKKKPWEKKDMPDFKQHPYPYTKDFLKVNKFFTGKVLVFNKYLFGKFLMARRSNGCIYIDCIGRNGEKLYLEYNPSIEDIRQDKEHSNRFLIERTDEWGTHFYWTTNGGVNLVTGIIHVFDNFDLAELALELGGIEL